MNARALIDAAHDAGVELEADGENIRIRPAGVLPPALREELAASKPAVLALLRGTPARSVADACGVCGATDWIVSLIFDDGTRACSRCLLGRAR